MSHRRRLSVIVVACTLGLGHVRILTHGVVRLAAAQAGPVAAFRQSAPESHDSLHERFLVRYQGCALLGPDGVETERLESITNGPGAVSPDGRFLVFSKSEANPPKNEWHGQLVIQSRTDPADRTTVPLVWGTTGSSFLPLWSSDSQRILICEQGFNADQSRRSAFRVYDRRSKSVTTLKLPDEWWPSDWSADGNRLVTSLRDGDGRLRVAWVRVDGTGKPEFLTPENQTAYGARLSPDNRQILCMIGPKTTAQEERPARLCVIEVATKKPAVIDKPGHTHGYCWASDGSKVAYTWQLPLRQPNESVERKTYLITCDPEGSNQKTVTMRRYEVPSNSSGRDRVVYFFEVVAWWRR